MLERLRDHFSTGRSEGSEEFIVYKILDVLADSFFPAPGCHRRRDRRARGRDRQPRRRGPAAAHLRAETGAGAAAPDRHAPARPAREHDRPDHGTPGLRGRHARLLPRVYDHMIRVSDLIDSYRDLLTGALDVYLSTVSNRLNSVMERLTIVATIFLPLTFVTGFFGMNFGWMVQPHRHVRGVHDPRHRRRGGVRRAAADPLLAGRLSSGPAPRAANIEGHTSRGRQASTWSIRGGSGKPRSPVGLVKPPGKPYVRTLTSTPSLPS